MQLFMNSMRDTLSGLFDVANPSATVTLDSPTWVSGWHDLLLALTKSAIHANRDDTQEFRRRFDDLFAHLHRKG